MPYKPFIGDHLKPSNTALQTDWAVVGSILFAFSLFSFFFLIGGVERETKFVCWLIN